MTSPKNRLVQVYSKSAPKTNHKDFYFPALAKKANVNFPFQKSLFFKQSKNDKKNKAQQHSIKELVHLNPQSKQETKNNSQLKISSNSFNDIAKTDKILSQHFPMHKMSNRTNKSAMYFTNRQMQELQKSSIEQIQKRSQLQSKFLQKRQDFQDFKKKKQMIRSQQKQSIMLDILTRKLQRQRQQRILQRRRNEQKIFIHEQKLSKIDMERFLKFRCAKYQLNLAKQKYIQTEDLSHFLKMEEYKAKKNHMNLLESRLVFLMSNKIKQQNAEEYVNQRMTSRTFYGEDNKSSRMSKSQRKNENC